MKAFAVMVDRAVGGQDGECRDGGDHADTEGRSGPRFTATAGADAGEQPGSRAERNHE